MPHRTLLASLTAGALAAGVFVGISGVAGATETGPDSQACADAGQAVAEARAALDLDGQHKAAVEKLAGAKNTRVLAQNVARNAIPTGPLNKAALEVLKGAQEAGATDERAEQIRLLQALLDARAAEGVAQGELNALSVEGLGEKLAELARVGGLNALVAAQLAACDDPATPGQDPPAGSNGDQGNDGDNGNDDNNGQDDQLGDGSGKDKDCVDFPTQADAQAVLDADRSDPNNLDADRDGIACEVDEDEDTNDRVIVHDDGDLQVDAYPVGGVSTGGGPA